MTIDPVQMTIQGKAGTEVKKICIGCVAGARYAGRDVEATRKALDEQIAKEGRYSSAGLVNPSIFRITRDRLTQSETFEVQGALTGGEAEVVAIRTAGKIFVSIGSDHCDRELDPFFPDKPKQMCPHPVANVAWQYDDIREHWDELRLYSEVSCNGHVITLQDSPLSDLVNLDYLLAMETVKNLPDPMFLYCGTTAFLPNAAEQVEKLGLPEMTSSGVGDSFVARLTDPVLSRTIEHKYSAIPVGDDYDERKNRGDSRVLLH